MLFEATHERNGDGKISEAIEKEAPNTPATCNTGVGNHRYLGQIYSVGTARIMPVTN